VQESIPVKDGDHRHAAQENAERHLVPAERDPS
jgi:hypothetical protein